MVYWLPVEFLKHGGQALQLGQTCEFAAWEIAQLESWH